MLAKTAHSITAPRHKRRLIAAACLLAGVTAARASDVYSLMTPYGPLTPKPNQAGDLDNGQAPTLLGSIPMFGVGGVFNGHGMVNGGVQATGYDMDASLTAGQQLTFSDVNNQSWTVTASNSVNPSVAPIPLPDGFWLIATGLAVLTGIGKRRRVNVGQTSRETTLKPDWMGMNSSISESHVETQVNLVTHGVHKT